MHHSRDPPGDRRGSSKGNRTSSQWIRGHCDNPGNDVAERLAKDAAGPGKTHPFRPSLARKRALIPQHPLWERERKASTEGGQLRKIDSTLPAAYTKKLYGKLPRNRAYLLSQLRTGHNWLSTYRKTLGLCDDDRCMRHTRNCHLRPSGLFEINKLQRESSRSWGRVQ